MNKQITQDGDMSEWIKTRDKLPNHRDVLVYICNHLDDDLSGVDIGRYDSECDGWAVQDETVWQYNPDDNEVTHWMPLPEPPNKEQDDE